MLRYVLALEPAWTRGTWLTLSAPPWSYQSGPEGVFTIEKTEQSVFNGSAGTLICGPLYMERMLTMVFGSSRASYCLVP